MTNPPIYKTTVYTPAARRRAGLRITRFDRMVALVVVALIGLIGLTLALGDRVGVQIRRTAPVDVASSTTTIAIQFSEAMDWDSVIERLRYDPPLQGAYTWSGTTLRFRPDDALEPGSAYSVTLASGAQSSGGRQVLRPAQFDFRVRTPRVAYLAPSDAMPQNIWIADPADPDSSQQLTYSPTGILNFDISPDGTRVAFAERSSNTGTADIKLLDLETGALTQLTNCVDSDCNSPVWRPDGGMIAYHRVDYNTGLDSLGVSPTRVWLIDLGTTPPTNRPLFSDSQILGYAPQWSEDGQRIIVYDNNSIGILVYDFTDGSLLVIPTRSGGGDVALSPDGRLVVFPLLIIDQATGGARTTLQMADLETGRIDDLTHPDDPIDDATSAWHPDGRYLALARRYMDDRYTRGRQIYLLDTETGDVTPLVVDGRYFNGFFFWDPSGDQLVMQRFPELTEAGESNPAGRPEIWTYQLETGTLTQVATNAMFPRWVP
jgi:Tol biopolymer transport system component